MNVSQTIRQKTQPHLCNNEKDADDPQIFLSRSIIPTQKKVLIKHIHSS
jgi:hypothetical protein